MQLPDINLLVYAHRADSPRHKEAQTWLETALSSEEAVALTGSVLSGFVRVVTNSAAFRTPTPLGEALEFARFLREEAGTTWLSPGDTHWSLFDRICRGARVTGNLVPDAFLAALALEHGCEIVTFDRDFARFKGLKWMVPEGA